MHYLHHLMISSIPTFPKKDPYEIGSIITILQARYLSLRGMRSFARLCTAGDGIGAKSSDGQLNTLSPTPCLLSGLMSAS